MIVVADADIDGRNNNLSYQDELEALLDRDDIAAATRFVQSLANSPDVAPSLLNSMNQQIWRTKAALVIEYSEQMRKAITSSDLASMKDFSQRIQQLVSPTPSETPVPAPPEGSTETIAAPEDEVLDEPSTTTTAAALAATSPPAADSDQALEPMQRALDDGRYIEPADDNAFDLAALRLADTPDDAAARASVDRFIGVLQAEVTDLLEEDRPEAALARARELLDTFDGSGEREGWRADYRPALAAWFERLRPDIAAGLITKTEAAIERHDLTVAVADATSAMDYLDLLASLVGIGHRDVAKLAGDIEASYRDLVDYRLARNDFDKAMTLIERMETVASRFELSLDETRTLRRDIDTAKAKQQRHDELMSLALQSRRMGQLIRPSGANAIEFTAKAVQLAVNPSAANKVLHNLIAEQRQRIDLLIEARRFRDAGLELESFATTIDKAGIDQGATATDLRAEAGRLLQKTDLEASLRQQPAVQENNVATRPSPPASPELLESRTAKPFTFINPF